ncbi:MAG: hypothetical protein XXXNARYT_003807 [Candidatus Accumulibacter regalis]
MRTNFVLVDFENVQPKDLGLLKDGLFKVKLFLGPNQSKIPVALASSLQSLGSNAEYIVLETAGNNALDFHIAYYIGLLSAEDPSAFFHIISKDSGFDPLIKHLKGRKVFAQRSTCIANIPFFKPTLPATPEAQIEVVVADLIRRKTSKPRTQQSMILSCTAYGTAKVRQAARICASNEETQMARGNRCSDRVAERHQEFQHRPILPG